MGLANRLAITLLVQGLLLAGLVVSLLNLVSAFEALDATEKRRFESYLLADELRQSSDDQTRMARSYVVTGDRRFALYFDEIGRIRDGVLPRPENYHRVYWDFVLADPGRRVTDGPTISLLDRMRAAGFVDQELDLLAEAKRLSDSLFGLERRAMELIVPDEAGPNEARPLPSKVEADNRALARTIMHGAQYHRAKAAIMAPIDAFLASVDLRTARERDRAEEAVRHALQLSLMLAALLSIYSVWAAFMLAKRVRRPIRDLARWAEQVEKGDFSVRTHLSGGEFGSLSRSIDTMADSVESALKALKEEVARRTRAEEEIRHLANHDALTGLPSLRLLRDRLEQALAQAKRHGHGLGLLFVDLNKFKPINDTYGHGAGDLVLKETAHRLRDAVRHSDTVARIGGDEFVVLLPDASTTEAIEAVGRKLEEVVRRPIVLTENGNVEVAISASMGMALYPADGEDADTLLKRADEEMYRLKTAAGAAR